MIRAYAQNMNNFTGALRALLFQSTLLFSLVFLNTGHAAAQPEQLLMQALSAIQSSDLPKAEQLLKNLIEDEPDFKLAQMLYADVLKSKVSTLSSAGMGISGSEGLANMITEVQARYSANQQSIQDKGKIPAALSRLDENYQYAMAVDLKQSRLFVFENIAGQPKQVADYYISMGRGGAIKEKEGDLRTPLGVYFVQSFIPESKLDDRYGAGAYPINYPNAWDTFNKRTGSGIWLHGTHSGTYNRPPLASEGCVVLSNDDLIDIGSYITLGQTPVLIGHDLEWLATSAWQERGGELQSIFTQWIDDWQSLKVDNYLSHYSEKFNNGKKNFARWSKHKKRVSKHKTYIKVDASKLSLLKHPNDNVMVATFRQNYKSDNYSGMSWKRQYWRKESDGQWRIIYEGEIPWPAEQQLAAKTP